MSRFLRVLSVVCILVVLPVQPAKACSCFYGDPRDRFQEADGASRTEVDEVSPDWTPPDGA